MKRLAPEDEAAKGLTGVDSRYVYRYHILSRLILCSSLSVALTRLPLPCLETLNHPLLASFRPALPYSVLHLGLMGVSC